MKYAFSHALLVFCLQFDPVKLASSIQFSILPSVLQLQGNISKCRSDPMYCEQNVVNIINLSSNVANQYTSLLMHDTAQYIISGLVQSLNKESFLWNRLNYILATLAFSQGDIAEVRVILLKDGFNTSDLISHRCLCAQTVISGQEQHGIKLLTSYTELFMARFSHLINESIHFINQSTESFNMNIIIPSKRFPSSSEEIENELLSLFLNEAQGIIRTKPRLYDIYLSLYEFENLDTKFRFRLGVGLAKLGFFELSLRHISLSSTPWEAPLYRLRAKLVFPPVHTSLRALALVVNEFETQAESEYLRINSKSSTMHSLCNSLTECALALQSLPLLHLAGYSAPLNSRTGALGYSPIALPVLLSDVYSVICPPVTHTRNIAISEDSQTNVTPSSPSKELKADRRKVIGIVSGTMDTHTGRIVIAILEDMPVALRRSYRLIGICLPTPRDAATDRANNLFDKNINIPPDNKTLAIERIMEARVDVLVFADPALDARVFALAHERMAPIQVALWGWGGSLGIPAVDFFLVPELLWRGARCPVHDRRELRQHGAGVSFILPQELYLEQVILLEGLPPLPKFIPSSSSVASQEMWTLLQDTYLVPPPNSSHLYLLPASIRHIHPEFDAALSVLLNTDPFAVIIVAAARSGRDQLPVSHPALRHDLTHPSSPAAALAKLRKRLRSVIGEASSRIRFLPPLEEKAFAGLRGSVVAVLDPYPVGLHLPILEALIDGVPVVSAPTLQECTNSYSFGLTQNLNVGIPSRKEERWPETPEEYAVFAMRLQRERSLRNSFRPIDLGYRNTSHGLQLLQLVKRMSTSFMRQN